MFHSNKTLIHHDGVQFHGDQGFHVKLKLSTSHSDDDLIDSTLDFCRGFCSFNLRHKSYFRLVLIEKATHQAELLLNIKPAENILTRVKMLLPSSCSTELTYHGTDSFQAIYASKHFDKTVNKLKTKKKSDTQSFFLFLADGIPFDDTNTCLREVGAPFFIESHQSKAQNGIISKQWDVLLLNLLHIREEFISTALLKQKLWQLTMKDVEKVSANFETVEEVKLKFV